MQLEISVAASEDLRTLHLYGVGKYGVRAADGYLDTLFAKFEEIAQWPYAARERLAGTPPVRLRTHVAHNIVYSVANDAVTIIRVLHNAANWTDLID